LDEVRGKLKELKDADDADEEKIVTDVEIFELIRKT
jgi:hypothetical protein